MHNELVFDMLDRIAQDVVPNRIHTLLHVNCRQSFVETAAQLLETKALKPTASNVKFLASNWEHLLYTKYSMLN